MFEISHRKTAKKVEQREGNNLTQRTDSGNSSGAEGRMLPWGPQFIPKWPNDLPLPASLLRKDVFDESISFCNSVLFFWFSKNWCLWLPAQPWANPMCTLNQVCWTATSLGVIDPSGLCSALLIPAYCPVACDLPNTPWPLFPVPQGAHLSAPVFPCCRECSVMPNKIYWATIGSRLALPAEKLSLICFQHHSPCGT